MPSKGIMIANAPSCSISVDDKVAEADPNLPLLRTLTALGHRLTAPCSGNGTCGKCVVRVVDAATVSPLTETEKGHFTSDEIAAGKRLACLTQPLPGATATIRIPRASRAAELRMVPDGAQREIELTPPVAKHIVTLRPQTLDDPRSRLAFLRRLGGLRADLRADLALLRRLPSLLPDDGTVTLITRDDRLLDVESGDTREACYGVAIDLGTTTVVATLVDLRTGRVAGHGASINRQVDRGHDLITRIQAADDDADGLDALRALAVDSINAAVESARARAGIERDRIYDAVLVGNATMIHLALGISPRSLGRLPFVALIEDALDIPAREIGLTTVHENAGVHVLPGIEGFVGADTTAAMLATGFDEDDSRIRLLADIGTNCEMVLRVGDRLLTTSDPAGPAFEGFCITYGMYAEPGAIEKVALDGDVRFDVIGDEPPRGLCGSALIDIAAELLRVGIVDETGRMQSPAELNGNVSAHLKARLIERDANPAFRIADEIDFTQKDLRQLQLAKGCIHAAMAVLLEREGLTPDRLDEICIAGGFGRHVDASNAVRLGLLPEVPHDRIVYAGNAAVEGARLALLSSEMRRRAVQLALRASRVQVAETPDFQMRFADAMLFTTAPEPAGPTT